jgi:cytochrome b involved in lipid metabolism
MYDIIFIGCGISNLYLASKLKDKKILILEKKGNNGGRIKTRNYKNIYYELGAHRIHKSHKLLLNLIKDLNLENKLELFENKKDIIFIKNNKYKKLNEIIINNYKKIINTTLKEKNIINSNFYNILEKEYSKDIIEDLINYNGYNLMYKNMNYNDYKNNYYQKEDIYYYLKDGLQQLIDKLSNNLPIINNCLLEDIIKKDNYFIIKTNIKTYKTKKIVLGIPKENLLKINYLKSYYPLLNSVSSNNFIRIYALFPKINNKYWFESINTTYTNTILRKIILDYNSKNGLIQICYNDGIDATNMKNIILNNKLEEVIMNNLIKIFPKINIPKPTKLFYQYWYSGTHYTKPNYDSSKLYNKIMNLEENLYINGECYSKKQGWIEGSLEVSSSIYNLINNSESYFLKKSITKKNINKKEFEKNKDKWTIINNNVYDLTQFIKKHPGGDVIKYALGIDSTNIFNGVAHSNEAIYLLEKYKIGVFQN